MGVICKYFQQGRCRFGNDCKFQHSDAYDDGGGGNRGDQYHYYKAEKPDVNVILQTVQQEVITCEKGKQWPLSCFAPLKEYGNISGWVDISPEELRWQMYLSRQSGNLDECIKQIQDVHQKAKIKKNAMLNPTLESYSILESIFTKDASSFSFGQVEGQTPNTFTPGVFGGGGSSFAQPPAPTVFGGATAQGGFATAAAGHSSSIFGGATTTTPFFGAPAVAPSAFGNTSSTNVFGNVAAAPANVFGNVAAAPANVFGNVAAAPAIVVAPVAAAPANVFGNVAAAPANVFGNVAAAPANVFGNVAAAPANLFGNVSATPANVFGNVATAPANVFGNVAAAPANVFGNVAAAPANVFGNVTAAPSVFGAQAHSASIFGGHQAQPVSQSSAPSVFGNTNAGELQSTSVAGDDTYTPMDKLSEEVLALFKADKYVMGKIPTVPPPRELCS